MTKQKIIMIVSAVIVGISLIYTFVNYQNYSAKVDTNKKQYSELKEEYASATETQESISEEDIKTGLNSAKKSGDDVATLLNQYLNALSYTGTNFTETQENQKKEEREEISKQLDAYFGEGSIMRTGVYPFDMSLVKNQNCWSFKNSYNFSGDTIDVLWVCSDNSGNTLAYVTADYHVDTNSFDNVSNHITILGNNYFSYTGDKVDKSTDTSNIFDVMQNASITDEDKKALEEYHNDKDAMAEQEANEAARAEMKKQAESSN